MLNWLRNFFLTFASIFKSNTTSDPNNATSNINTLEQSEASNRSEQTSDIENSIEAIPFYPKLIENLETDHQHLLSVYGKIQEALNTQQYQLIPELLSTFQDDLNAHLNTENIKFYGYLEQSLKGKIQEFKEMRAFRKEIRAIERAVIKFLQQWINTGVNSDNVTEFKAEYAAIGSALVSRIESEEKSLYTLYQQV